MTENEIAKKVRIRVIDQSIAKWQGVIDHARKMGRYDDPIWHNRLRECQEKKEKILQEP